eukprot:1018110-Amphidinium_carterae.1
MPLGYAGRWLQLTKLDLSWPQTQMRLLEKGKATDEKAGSSCTWSFRSSRQGPPLLPRKQQRAPARWYHLPMIKSFTPPQDDGLGSPYLPDTVGARGKNGTALCDYLSGIKFPSATNATCSYSLVCAGGIGCCL